MNSTVILSDAAWYRFKSSDTWSNMVLAGVMKTTTLIS